MKLLYDLFFILFSIFYIPCLFFRSRLHRDFLQRFGFLPKEVTDLSRPIWIHAVSVGEAALAVKLSQSLKKTFDGSRVIISTTTRTGNDMVRKAGRGAVDAVFYYPLDLSFIVKRVVRIIKPSLYLMIETEIWPNLLEELHSGGIAVVLINGRISDKSFENYKRIKFVTRRILDCISCFCMQSDRDAERIKNLGAPANDVYVTGNIKFDEGMVESGAPAFNRERIGFKEDDKIIVAGSTHFPEEKIVIDAYKNLKERTPGLKLILAPRHVERADAVKVYIEKAGLKYCLFSDILKRTAPSPPAVAGEASPKAGAQRVGEHSGPYDVLLVDTIGHLKDLYGVGDIVFIGGSLVEKGGQNPIEAARWAKPVIFGPHMFNFREVANIFLGNKAAICADDASKLEQVLRELLLDSDKRQAMSRNAKNVIQENSGALVKTVDRIGQYVV